MYYIYYIYIYIYIIVNDCYPLAIFEKMVRHGCSTGFQIRKYVCLFFNL